VLRSLTRRATDRLAATGVLGGLHYAPALGAAGPPRPGLAEVVERLGQDRRAHGRRRDHRRHRGRGRAWSRSRVVVATWSSCTEATAVICRACAEPSCRLLVMVPRRHSTGTWDRSDCAGARPSPTTPDGDLRPAHDRRPHRFAGGVRPTCSGRRSIRPPSRGPASTAHRRTLVELFPHLAGVEITHAGRRARCARDWRPSSVRSIDRLAGRR